MSYTKMYHGTGGRGRAGAARRTAGLVLLAAVAAAMPAGCQKTAAYRLGETDTVVFRENGREQPLSPGVVEALNSYLESSKRVKWSDIEARKASEMFLTVVDGRTGRESSDIGLIFDASGGLVAIDPIPVAMMVHDLYASDDTEKAKKVMDALWLQRRREAQPVSH